MVGHGILKPDFMVTSSDRHKMTARSTSEGEQSQPPPQHPDQAPQQQNEHIDPDLYSIYHDPGQHATYDQHAYPYPATGHHPHSYHQHQQQPHPNYAIPSLEQIANEVLVDMSGTEHEPGTALPDGLDQIRAFNAGGDSSPASNGEPPADSKPDGSVDSGVALPANDTSKQAEEEAVPLTAEEPKDAVSLPVDEEFNSSTTRLTNGATTHDDSESASRLPNGDTMPNGSSLPSITNSTQQQDGNTSRPTTANKASANDLPLWQPPAPIAKSPESVKRQPKLTNGASSPLPAEPASIKRKRDSTSATPGAKKMKLDAASPSVNGEVDKESMELAKMLQQEELGLRRRGSK
jgi:F-box and leucine-rich repeat protein 10/11